MKLIPTRWRSKAAALSAGVALTAAALTGAVASAPPAGAGTSSLGAITCGFAPSAPNVVDSCSIWHSVAGSPAYTARTDISHHAGWWGSNYDPGTYHVITYLYNTSVNPIALVGQIFNMDIGDWGVPWMSGGSNPALTFRPFNAVTALAPGLQQYRGCTTPSPFVSWMWTSDTVAFNTYAAGNMWPVGQVSGGAQCQHGFGSHTDHAAPQQVTNNDFFYYTFKGF